MCERALGFLELVTRLKPDVVLPCLLRDGLIEGLCRILAQCTLMVGVVGGGASVGALGTHPLASKGVAGALPLASAIISLLLSLVGVAPSLAGQEMVLSSLQLHWSSFTGEWIMWSERCGWGEGVGAFLAATFYSPFLELLLHTSLVVTSPLSSPFHTIPTTKLFAIASFEVTYNMDLNQKGGACTPCAPQ